MKIVRYALGLPFGVLLLLTACAVTALLGCASAPVYDGAHPAAQLAAAELLIIENQRTVDEWIYLERDGANGRKLGRVGSLSTDTLVLRDSDVIPGTRFMLDAIAFPAGNADQSDAITAIRGAVYRWQLAPMRGTNFISARSAE